MQPEWNKGGRTKEEIEEVDRIIDIIEVRSWEHAARMQAF
jgi:hypothetical protein